MNDKKKAVIIGGSNGIGIAIASNLINQNYHPIILDIVPPDRSIISDKNTFNYHYFNMLDFDEDFIYELASDKSVKTLFITSGIGRIAGFESFNTVEIEKTFKINSVSAVKILRIFYNRINSHEDFYCGIMGSIAGWVNSPLFALYAASKASICRFTESVNVELKMKGIENRILNVSPGSIKGTKFNGGNNEIEIISPLAIEIVDHLFRKTELFIPDYEKTFKNVIERYKSDENKFGCESYEYKMQSGRVFSESKIKIGYLSGTFDLFHIGHLNLLRRAKENCDYLIVGVHHDASHKGKETFISFDERKQIVSACRYVDKVVNSCQEDSDAWKLYNYDKLFVGSDYKGTERFNRYEEFFKDKPVDIIYFDYTKGTSSTQLRNILTKEDNYDT